MTIEVKAATPEQAMEKVVEIFEGFFRAGGILSWSEYSQLSSENREAARIARDSVLIESHEAFIDAVVDRLNESNQSQRAENLLAEIGGKLE